MAAINVGINGVAGGNGCGGGGSIARGAVA